MPLYIRYVLGYQVTHPAALLINVLCCSVTDAVPKKRGPKTDVLEALLKRVDGLEQKLKEKKTEPAASASENKQSTAQDESSPNGESSGASTTDIVTSLKLPKIDTSRAGADFDESAIYSPTPAR